MPHTPGRITVIRSSLDIGENSIADTRPDWPVPSQEDLDNAHRLADCWNEFDGINAPAGVLAEAKTVIYQLVMLHGMDPKTGLFTVPPEDRPALYATLHRACLALSLLTPKP